MTKYPRLQFKLTPETRTKRITTITEFQGINHTPGCGPGEWYDENNLISDNYPMTAVRGRRTAVNQIADFPVPTDVVSVCGAEPPVYLTVSGKAVCGGHEQRIIQIEQKWSEAVATVDDPGNVHPVYDIGGDTVAQYQNGLRELAETIGITGSTDTEPTSGVCYIRYVDDVIETWELYVIRNREETVLESDIEIGNHREPCMNAYQIFREADGAPIPGETAQISLTPYWDNGSTTPRQMVMMGAYAVVWPDKAFINVVKLANGDTLTEGIDYGNIAISHTDTATSRSPYYCYLCRRDGTPLITSNEKEPGAATAEHRCFFGVNEPSIPSGLTVSAGDYWFQILDSTYTNIVAAVYDTTMGWIPTDDYAVKIWHEGIGVGIKPGYSVTVSGWNGIGSTKAIRAVINKAHSVIAAGDNYIVIADAFVLASAANLMRSGSMGIDTDVPDLDYVVECNNRLWGCYYGRGEDGEILNELYGSALGDFRSWRQYEGLSTDSWTASRGETGPWTGAAVLDGHPLFFKEHSLEKIYVSSQGAHQVVTVNMDGVQQGSSKSLVVIDDRLYYRSPLGICRYTGSLPTIISEKLGPEIAQYKYATAGRYGKKYVIEMQDDTKRILYVYDTTTGIWHMEDAVSDDIVDSEANLQTLMTYDDRIYYTMQGRVVTMTEAGDSRMVQWFAETGNIGLQTGRRKYISRIRIRLKLVYSRSTARISISYDDGATWEQKWESNDTGVKLETLNIYPRRHDRCRLKFEGAGGCSIQLVEYQTEIGSDV